MFSIKSLSHFDEWLTRLPDASVRGVIVARIKRLERGLMGDVQPLGDKVSELRIHFGAGWRIYFMQRDKRVIVAKRIKVAELPEFDPTRYLDDETAIAAYLTDIISANDGALLAAALGDIARARGMTEIAKASGLTREALYKALRPSAKPRYETIAKVCEALGVRLVAQPVDTHPAS